MSQLITIIRVSRCFPGLRPSAGFAMVGNMRLSCSLGRSGITVRKREGDGATPRGEMVILGGYFRADRWKRRRASISMRRTRSDDGWCDDPGSYLYNRPVRLPTRVRCERMALEDNVYDVVLTTSHNMKPRQLGAGSAIFVHLRRSDGGPTAGCIAFAPADMRRLLPRLSKRVRVIVA
ncbi:MAG: L,D-transpeptidase [Beijerinckiaceae bacterium]